MKRTQNKPFFALDVALEVVGLVGPLVARVGQADGDLARQMRKAVTSIPLNVSEGSSRLGKDTRYHYSVAAGSARELDASLRVCVALGYLRDADTASALELLDRQHALLWGLMHRRR